MDIIEKLFELCGTGSCLKIIKNKSVVGKIVYTTIIAGQKDEDTKVDLDTCYAGTANDLKSSLEDLMKNRIAWKGDCTPEEYLHKNKQSQFPKVSIEEALKEVGCSSFEELMKQAGQLDE